jgi:hypothetical protein
VKRLGASLALLLALSLPARGADAWKPIGESDATAHYFDPSTVRTEGQRKRVWRLFEHKGKAVDGVQSGKALIEIDCREWTFRYVRTLYYGGRMGHGKYLGGGGEQPADHIGPDSMVGHLAKAVCAS